MVKVDNIILNNLMPKTHALTVDVEDYFQVSAFENIVQRNTWDDLEHRVEHNTHNVLDMFAKHNATATFFVLGWVAERYPSLITRIINEGHELASHGYGHKRLTQMTRAEIFSDISKSKIILEDISATAILGYRAPSFSINDSNRWVFSILNDLGFQYSSSSYPIKHDLYGEPNWARSAFTTEQGILEIPLPTFRVNNTNYPIAGGGYYRLLPYFLNKFLINKYINSESSPYMFYFHPWEIDPNQPKFDHAPLKSKLRHYTNLSNMQNKIEKLLSLYQWQSIQHVYQISAKQLPITTKVETESEC